ncbi:unnamed protein product [Closterium sp. Yama58-4]|nr:unnamed protein product [Closterium sp. Yama58-4]
MYMTQLLTPHLRSAFTPGYILSRKLGISSKPKEQVGQSSFSSKAKDRRRSDPIAIPAASITIASLSWFLRQSPIMIPSSTPGGTPESASHDVEEAKEVEEMKSEDLEAVRRRAQGMVQQLTKELETKENAEQEMIRL